MTRKRFVKLLMSAGYSRNEAVDYVATCLPRHGSYRGMYLKWLVDRENPEFSETLTRLCKAAVAAVLDTQLALASIDWHKAVEGFATFAVETKEEDYG